MDSWSDNFQYCIDFCAYHDFDNVTKLKFAFGALANEKTCGGCIDRLISPNRNPSLDSIISKYLILVNTLLKNAKQIILKYV